MNAAQRDRAKAVIESAVFLCDSTLYLNARTAGIADAPRPFVCCAVGELALAAGHTPDELREASRTAEPEAYHVTLPFLVTEFGLTGADCEALADANDKPYGVALPDDTPAPAASMFRRSAILATLDRIAA